MIEICNLELSYEGEEKIFSSLSLKIEKNKPVLVISEPGCGKTSLAKALTGTASKFHSAKVSGSFFLDSLDLFSLDVPERKNYVARSIQNPDEAILFPTVEDEIAFPLEQRCLKREEMRKEISLLLDRYDLLKYRDADTAELSGGEKRRLNLATLDAISPKLFIYDEAFDELSASWRKRLLDLMREKEYVLVLGSHYLFEYENFFESTYELCDGSLFPYEKKSVPFVFPESKVGLGEHTLGISNLTFSQSHRAMREKKTFDLTVPTMRIESGRAYLLEGENGAGKSTLARLITGILEKRGGSITYDGKAVDEKRRKALVSYLFQNPLNQLYLPRVQDELMSVSSSPEEAERVADLFSLSLTDYTEELSYGKAKMLQAAIYYILNRPFAIFDEVDSAISYRDTMSLLTLYLERGSGVLMISHDERIISSFGGRIYHMREGRLE